jgi:pyruvate,water dikinase
VTSSQFSAENFPKPNEVDMFLAWDNLHAPRPLTPLSTIITQHLGHGFTAAMNEYACSVGLRFHSFNYYAYAGLFTIDPGPEGAAARRARYREHLKDLIPNLGELWSNVWEPSMVPGLDRARNTDYRSLSDQALIAEVEQMLLDSLARWTVHGRINFSLVAASWFADFYNETFQPETKGEAYECLQGFWTLSVQAGCDLWALSRTVKNTPALLALFEATDAKDLMPALEAMPEARSFLEAFRAYLDHWGWRADAIYEFGEPTWREDPSIPLNTLQGFIRLGEEGDPERTYRLAVTRREELLAQARTALANDAAKLARFNELYEAAKCNLNLTEDHNYYIDQMGVQVFRLPFLEIGRRLTERGRLSRPDSIFMLYLDEVRRALFSPRSWQTTVDQRRDEMREWAKIVPPPTLGTPPPPPASEEELEPFEEALVNKMLGVMYLPEPNTDPSVINGTPASPGSVQGTAKVVRSLSEASKLNPGDIMVCEMTMPPWTPLFATVGGIVADTGGILSHCAIVAREYRLPAVVGTLMGTRVIQDGWTITVDGTKGVVRIDKRG